MAATFGTFVGWVLKWAGIIFGSILVLYVISLIPTDVFPLFVRPFFEFLGWIFGTAAPRLGNIALDAIDARVG
jgi:uncharacterized membrane protein YdjX (TVP38/TMEM64 family)